MGPGCWNFSLAKAVDAITASNKTEAKQRSMGNTIAEGIWIRNCLAKRCWFDWVASGRIRRTQESEVRSLKPEVGTPQYSHATNVQDSAFDSCADFCAIFWQRRRGTRTNRCDFSGLYP